MDYKLSQKEGKFGAINEYTLYGDSARFAYELVGKTKKDINSSFLIMNKLQSELFLTTWSKLDGDSEKFKLQYDTEEIKDK